MFHGKKISGDILHLALIMVFVRLGPEILWNSRWQDTLEVGDMFLGSTLAYRQFATHNMYASSNHYINLKNLDTVIMDDVISVRDRLDYFYRSDVLRENVIAYYPNPPDSQVSEGRNSEQNSTSEICNAESSSSSNVPNGLDEEEGLSMQSFESLYSPAALDLSPEDMDLIEILWKQDIDLGVSRDAFNAHENPDQEKLKAENDILKDSKEFKVEENALTKRRTECEEDISLYSDWEGLSYTVDSETGEHIIQEQKVENEQTNLSTNQSFFCNEDLEVLSPSMFPTDNCQDFNITKELIEECDLSEPLNDTLLADPDMMAAQVEKLENFIMNSEGAEYLDQDLETGSEMYPSMEEYWQDISTTLPLSVMGPTSYQGCLNVLPRPNRMFPDVPDNHSAVGGYSSSSELVARSSASDAYPSPLLHNATLAQRTPDINSSFAYLSPILGPTSLGCAVASSIATLTNDTDPIPDITSTVNGTYGLDLPGILHTNHTAITSSNEVFLSEMLLDEELQLMHVGASSEPDVHYGSVPASVSDHADLSSDSANSSASGNMSSLSDCNENRRMKFEDLSCAEHSSKDSLYATSKYHMNQPSMGLAYSHSDPTSNSQSYDVGVPRSYRGNCSHYLQHNHSYHLPFVNGDNSPKPVTRDKAQFSQVDDDANRDEKRAKAMKLPITISDIINLAIDEFNEKLSKFELTEPQLTLIRDIRRRGKNKVAAQNCRKRKMDQISSLQQDLDLLQAERLQLEAERTQLLHQRRNVQDKYSQLCQLVLQSTSHPPLIQDVFPSSQQRNTDEPSPSASASDSPETERGIIFQGVRTKKKLDKKKFNFS